ncbi:hypothetical protein ACFL09_05845 [Planctomycetota bacterium]
MTTPAKRAALVGGGERDFPEIERLSLKNGTTRTVLEASVSRRYKG